MDKVRVTPYITYISNVPTHYVVTEWLGTSSENKPDMLANEKGSRFICADNGDEYIWSGSAWVLVNYGATDDSFEAIVGLPAEMDTDWKTDIVGAINELYEDSRPTHYNRTVVIESDFTDAATPTRAIIGATGAANGSGTAAAGTVTKEHPGVIALSDSTTANGGYYYSTGTSSILIGGGERAEFIFSLGAGAARTTASVRLGFHDINLIEGSVTDGVWLNIVGDGTKATINGKTNDNTGVATTGTSYTAEVDGTWYRGVITLNSNATLATFQIKTCSNGLQVWEQTLATKIPTGAGRYTGWGVIAGETTTDAAGVIINLDYANMSIDRTLVR